MAYGSRVLETIRAGTPWQKVGKAGSVRITPLSTCRRWRDGAGNGHELSYLDQVFQAHFSLKWPELVLQNNPLRPLPRLHSKGNEQDRF